jgi:hypothetical protein
MYNTQKKNKNFISKFTWQNDKYNIFPATCNSQHFFLIVAFFFLIVTNFSNYDVV